MTAAGRPAATNRWRYEMSVPATERCILRELQPGDAPFMRTLLNDPAFLEHIGDKHVRTEADARRHIEEGPRRSYAEHGYGMWAVEMRADGELAGVCGLLRRDFLDCTDLGFAFLPAYRGIGLGYETASAVISHARDGLGLSQLIAIVSEGNAASVALLGKLGFVRDGVAVFPDSDEVLQRYSLSLATWRT